MATDKPEKTPAHEELAAKYAALQSKFSSLESAHASLKSSHDGVKAQLEAAQKALAEAKSRGGADRPWRKVPRRPAANVATNSTAR